MINKYTIKDLPIEGKKILMRVDYNVPLDDKGNILDDKRICDTIPTINYALEHGAKVIILISHLGRPKGKVDLKYSLKPVAQRLSSLIDKEVKFIPDCVGPKVKQEVERGKKEDVILLENLRFHPGEEENSRDFARELSILGELYVNDAFSVCHRNHASLVAITEFYETPACGFLIEKEIEYFSKIFTKPAKPLVLILGGKKIEDKLGVLKSLINKVDYLLVGGGAVFTMLKAKGKNVGNSIINPDLIEEVKKFVESPKVMLPVDFKAAKSIEEAKNAKDFEEEIPEEYTGFDIGPKTIQNFKNCLKDAKTIIWAGPLGVYEKHPFDKASKDLGNYICGLTGTISIAAGGDTSAMLSSFGLSEKFTHISTAGGAFLKLLEGKELPGIKALKDKDI